MFLHNDKINQIFFLMIIFATLLTGCGGGSSSTDAEVAQSTSTPSTSTPSTSTPSTSTPSTSTPSSSTPSSSTSTTSLLNKAVHQGQVIDSSTGSGIEGVEVSIGSSLSITDTNGYYTFDNIPKSDIATIHFEKEGYLSGSSQIVVKEESDSINYLEYTMHAYNDNVWTDGKPWSYETATGASGGAVIIPEDTIHTDEKGDVYEGTVSARWYFGNILDNTETRDVFPGSFQGKDSNGIVVPFVSFALMAVELRDTSGNLLNVSENITLNLPSLSGTSEEHLGLWYYDYGQGLWIQEGYAQKQPDGTYSAEITHAGTWSISQAINEDTGIYRGHIMDVNGDPMSNVRLKAIGENWTSSDLSTDENGIFEIAVIPNSSFNLSAYDYNAKFGATYPNMIPAIAAGGIVED